MMLYNQLCFYKEVLSNKGKTPTFKGVCVCVCVRVRVRVHVHVTTYVLVFHDMV